jgi:hypothetical protein
MAIIFKCDKCEKVSSSVATCKVARHPDDADCTLLVWKGELCEACRRALRSWLTTVDRTTSDE